MAKILSIFTLLTLTAFLDLTSSQDPAKGPPRLQQRLDNLVKVKEGRTVKLKCPVEGNPPPLTSWYKGKESIELGWERYHILKRSLKITDVELSDSGQYYCQVTNGFGSVTLNYTVTVTSRRKRKESKTQLINPLNTSNREMPINSIKPKKAFPEARPIDPQKELSNGGTLPKFSQPEKMHKKSIVRPQGSAMRLKCAATATPRPRIFWKKDGRMLDDEDMREREGSSARWTLKLKDLKASDSGHYTCIVKNEVGEINATYIVEVIEPIQYKPVLTGLEPLNKTVEYGGNAVFQCKVRSDASPHIQWLKRVGPHTKTGAPGNGTIVVNGTKFYVLPSDPDDTWARADGTYVNKLTVKHATEKDDGMYICLGANTMGYSFKSAFLHVLADPNNLPSNETDPSDNGAGHSSLPPFPLPVIVAIPASLCLLILVGMIWCCYKQRQQSYMSAASSGASSLSQQPVRAHSQPTTTSASRDQFPPFPYNQASSYSSGDKVNRYPGYHIHSQYTDTLNSSHSHSSTCKSAPLHSGVHPAHPMAHDHLHIHHHNHCEQL